ncbi:MAG: sodium:alanine symporter family protein [Synergistaceae bacterium]|jgi:AGCS family alanine or glycine:cation symporter|nr:sodium:alanine symporter family protein [Synergistaceae bacterium]
MEALLSSSFFEQLLAWVSKANSFLWGEYCLILLLCGTGLFFTFKLKGVQIFKFGKGFKRLFGDFSFFGAAADKEGMSSFQAVATAIAAQVGTGNLVGAMTALVAGGPGAIFWMWVAAFFGMATIFAEACLAQLYRATDENGQAVGGPAYYISKGLGDNFFSKALAAFFSVTIILALGFMGNMVQANSISDAFYTAWGIDTKIVGVALAAIAGVIFIGGIKRIASVTEKIVPFMAIVYIVAGVAIMVKNNSHLPAVFGGIFAGAFDPQAVWGGVLGITMAKAARYGIARGLFSNEAGMGSTPHAHAVAKVKHPVEQGMLAIVSVFIDTFIVLNITVFTVLSSDVIVFENGQSTLKGISLVQAAFAGSLMGSYGYAFVAACLLFFAFSTIIGWYYFAETNIRYLFGSKALLPYQILVMVFIFTGSVLKIDLVWELADFFNGIMVIPNLLALLFLSGKVLRLLKEYDEGVPYDPKRFLN